MYVVTDVAWDTSRYHKLRRWDSREDISKRLPAHECQCIENKKIDESTLVLIGFSPAPLSSH